MYLNSLPHCTQLIMVIGQCGVQFGLQSNKWLTKSEDREVGVRFVNREYGFYYFIIMLSISQNNDKIKGRN